jgi:hypothetical protein
MSVCVRARACVCARAKRYLLRAVEQVEAVATVTEEELEQRRQEAVRNFIASQTRMMEMQLQAERERELEGQRRRCVAIVVLLFFVVVGGGGGGDGGGACVCVMWRMVLR